jgi:hypothetical protein
VLFGVHFCLFLCAFLLFIQSIKSSRPPNEDTSSSVSQRSCYPANHDTLPGL